MEAPSLGPFRVGGKKSRSHPAAAHVFERVGPDGEQPERRVHEASWFGNMAYFAGQQNLFQQDGLFRRPKRAVDEQLYVVNLTIGKVLRAISKLMQMNARFAAAPNDDSLAARHASMVSEKIFEHVRNVTDFRSKLRRAMQWAAICGSGYLKTTWNPFIGTPNRIFLEKGMPSLEAEFDPIIRRKKTLSGEFEDTFPGEVSIDVVSPFQLYWDPNSNDEGFASSDWCAQIHIDSIPKLRRQYGDVVDDASVWRSSSSSDLYEEQIRYLAPGSGLTSIFGSADTHGDPRTKVIEFFEKASKDNDNRGRYILIVGNVVVRDEENPYVNVGGGLPFAKVDWFPMTGRWPALSLVEQLRPSQRAHNMARTMALRWQQSRGHAPAYFPKGAGVTPRKVQNEAGLSFEYNPSGPPPTFGPTPQMPQYIVANAEIAKNEMAEIAAQADPTNNSMPGQLRSGRAVQLMQEDNNLILTPTSDAIMDAVKEVGTQVLQLVSTNYSKPRTIRTVGDDGEWEVNQYAGVDLRDQTKVSVIGQPSRFETTESFKDDVLEFVSTGAINPENPKDKKLILQALASKSSDKMLNRLLRQERHEEQTIQRMIENVTYHPQVEPFHNPMVRAEILEDFLNTDEFEGLEDPIRMKLVERWGQFQTIIQQQMQAQLQAEMMTRGGAGEKGTASQPRPKATA